MARQLVSYSKQTGLQSALFFVHAHTQKGSLIAASKGRIILLEIISC